MGRLTKPFATQYNELVQRLRDDVREKLSSSERKEAFDKVIQASNAEMAAMNYAESFKLLDLFLLVGAVDI
jgi:hypothetical protein